MDWNIFTEKAKSILAKIQGISKVKLAALSMAGVVSVTSIGAGGYTMYQPQEENYDSKKDMLDSLVSLLGGRVAEALTMDDISTGASNDIERASSIAREMVTRYGMSDVIGPINYGGDHQEVFIGRDYGHVKNYSEETAAKIDEEVSRIINDAYKRTEKILSEHMDKLRLVALTLIEREKINKEEFIQLMEKGSIDDNEEENPDSAERSDATSDAISVEKSEEETSDEIKDNNTEPDETQNNQ